MNIEFGTTHTFGGTPQSWLPGYSVSLLPAAAAQRAVSNPYTVDDANYATVAYTANVSAYAINISESTARPGHTLENLTPGIASLTGSTLTVLASGTSVVKLSNSVSEQLIKTTVYSGTFAKTANTFQSFVAGSLGKHVTSAIAAMVSGKTPGNATQNPYTALSDNISAPACTRNASVFTGALDLAPISILNTHSGAAFRGHPGVLISARHLVGANHYQTQGPVVFQRPDGSYQTVNVVSSARIGSTDIRVFYLEDAVIGITPFPVLPGDWANYLPALLPGSGTSPKMPVIAKTRHDLNGNSADYLHVLKLIDADDTILTVSGTDAYTYMTAPEQYESWGTDATGGDSGGPVFIPINGVPVLLGVFYTAGWLPNLAHYRADINTAMNALATAAADPAAGSYAVQTVNLSGFTRYV